MRLHILPGVYEGRMVERMLDDKVKLVCAFTSKGKKCQHRSGNANKEIRTTIVPFDMPELASAYLSLNILIAQENHYHNFHSGAFSREFGMRQIYAKEASLSREEMFLRKKPDPKGDEWKKYEAEMKKKGCNPREATLYIKRGYDRLGNEIAAIEKAIEDALVYPKPIPPPMKTKQSLTERAKTTLSRVSNSVARSRTSGERNKPQAGSSTHPVSDPYDTDDTAVGSTDSLSFKKNKGPRAKVEPKAAARPVLLSKAIRDQLIVPEGLSEDNLVTTKTVFAAVIRTFIIIISSQTKLTRLIRNQLLTHAGLAEAPM